MVTGPLIAQGAVDHDEVGGLSRRNNLTCRGEANEQLAPAGEQLLGYEDGEGCTNDPTNNPDLLRAEVECVEFGVITGPARKWLCRPSLSQPTHQVAVGVQNADGGHRQTIEPLLSPCLAQQGCRSEHGRHGRVLIVEDRRNDHVTLDRWRQSYEG